MQEHYCTKVTPIFSICLPESLLALSERAEFDVRQRQANYTQFKDFAQIEVNGPE
jgi:hypothetical protein